MATAPEIGDNCLVEVPIRLPLAEIERLTRIVERARLSGMASAAEHGAAESDPARLARFARFVLTMRRRREAAFPLVEFGEPAWDMLLDLYVQHVEGHPVSVSSLCTAASVPTTTALRWIDAMVTKGHFVRRRDQQDARRVHVSLTDQMVHAVEDYLKEMRHRALMALR